MQNLILRPDPIETANLYCEGQLDAALVAVVAPLMDELHAGGMEEWRLWFVRYARGGDHLKLRLHGPADEAGEVRRRLDAAAGRFLQALPLSPAVPRAGRPELPAIDEDDEDVDLHRDRALRWTRYRRSHVSLGPPLLLRDDHYVELMTAALAGATGLALEAIRSCAEPRQLPAARQRTLLKALISGLEALRFSAERRRLFLEYHRDWLVRFSTEGIARQEELRSRLDDQADRARPLQEQLRAVLAVWDGEEKAVPGGPAAGPAEKWGAVLVPLASYLEPRLDELAGVDPFTGDPVFPSLFKVFHGLANQLGMPPVQEAFIHHLLLRAAEPAAAAGVCS